VNQATLPALSTQMVCQACDGESAEREGGCPGCGGYGYVAAVGQCPECKRRAWFRPGVFTAYEGKRYFSLDALEMVCHGDGANCIHCEEAK
jgi:hypothetical protein